MLGDISTTSKGGTARTKKRPDALIVALLGKRDAEPV
jgi:hypothetical protein